MEVKDHKSVQNKDPEERCRDIPYQAQYLREIISETGSIEAISGYLFRDQTHHLEDFETGTVFELTGCTATTMSSQLLSTQIPLYTFITYRDQGRIDGMMTLPRHYAKVLNNIGLPAIVVKGGASPRHILLVNGTIIPRAHLNGDGQYTCPICGKKCEAEDLCVCNHTN